MQHYAVQSSHIYSSIHQLLTKVSLRLPGQPEQHFSSQ